ncbi:MAG: thioesterase [Eubacteriales bacterium]|nr:thioesterase [Eubacteriales bacterium]
MGYKESFKLSLEDIGKNKEITNKAILRVFENIATHQSDESGYGVDDIEKKGLAWLLLEWKIKVFKRIPYGEEVRANTWPRTFERFYSYRDFEMYNEKGELCVIGTSKWLLYNVTKGRINRLSDDIKNSYIIDKKNVFEIDQIETIDIPDKYDREYGYRAMRRDIDLNEHVHNLFYLDLAIEALPEEVFNSMELNNVRISYKKQIKLNDKIKCKYAYDGEFHTVTIFSEDEKEIHALIRLH